MPYLNGIELAEKLRKLSTLNNFRIILISAEEFKNADGLFDDVQNKPILPKALIDEYAEFYKNESFVFED